jgi:hypothetical protein
MPKQTTPDGGGSKPASAPDFVGSAGDGVFSFKPLNGIQLHQVAFFGNLMP